MKNTLLSLCMSSFIGTTLLIVTNDANAQVKIGANPTTITSNAHLEIEATGGSKTVITKGDGYVGVNNDSPTQLIHAKAAASSGQSILIESNQGENSVKLLTDGGISITRNGGALPLAPHIGGYLDFSGLTAGKSWRIAQYGSYLGFSYPGLALTNFPMYIHNNGHVTIGSNARLSTAILSVAGKIAGYGFSTRTGINGATSDNSFNIAFGDSRATLYIDETSLGQIGNTVSDYRLKKNVSTISKTALDRVKQLRPVNFEYKDIQDDIFKSDNINHEGFIAHELKSVIPSAVNGQKDALTKDGKIQPQSINAVPIIAILTQAIQELEAKVATLETENSKLKSTVTGLASITEKIIELETKLAQLNTSVSSSDVAHSK